MPISEENDLTNLALDYYRIDDAQAEQEHALAIDRTSPPDLDGPELDAKVTEELGAFRGLIAQEVGIGAVEQQTDPAKADVPMTPEVEAILDQLPEEVRGRIKGALGQRDVPKRTEPASVLNPGRLYETYRRMGTNLPANVGIGVVNAADNFTRFMLGNEITNAINETGDMLWPQAARVWREVIQPLQDRNDSTSDAIVQGASQFLIPFMGIARAMNLQKETTRVGQFLTGLAAENVTMATMFEPQMERVAETVRELGVEHVFIDWLASHGEDEDLETFKKLLDTTLTTVAVSAPLFLVGAAWRAAKTGDMDVFGRALDMIGGGPQAPFARQVGGVSLDGSTPKVFLPDDAARVDTTLVDLVEREYRPSQATQQIIDTLGVPTDDQRMMSHQLLDANAQVPRGKQSVREIVGGLEQRSAASKVVPAELENTPENVDRVANMMAAEFLIEHARPGSTALNWYADELADALSLAALKFPEIDTDVRANITYKLALAITSNGQSVNNNTKLAWQVYEHWRKTGRFDETLGWGKQKDAMKKAFGVFNNAIERWGWEDFIQMLNTRWTVGELWEFGFEVAGEAMDQVVPGSAIFGPKVGGGFFANLNGFFDVVTMDQWFTRTWNRYHGRMTTPPETVAEKMTDFRKAVTTKDLALIGMTRKDIGTEEGAGKAAGALMNYWSRSDWSDDVATPGIKAARQLQSAMGPINAPANSTQRKTMRAAVHRTIEILKEQGVEADAATVQAMLWFPEQRLYQRLGSRAVGNDTDYKQATLAMMKDLGYDDETLNAAIATPGGGSRGNRSSAHPGGSDGGVREDARRAFEETPTSRAVPLTARESFAAEQISIGLRDPGRMGGKSKGSIRQVEGSDLGGLSRAYDGRARTNPRIALGEGTKPVRAPALQTFGPHQTAQNVMKLLGVTPVQFSELDHAIGGAEAFHAALTKAREDLGEFGFSLSPKSVDELQSMRTFLSHDGKTGFALDGDNIVSVFNTNRETKRSSIGMLKLAVEQGGRRLDAYDTVLPYLYSLNGFRVVARLRWDDKFAPRLGDGSPVRFRHFGPEANGQPDTVFMVFDPSYTRAYRAGENATDDFYHADWDSAEAAAQAEVQAIRSRVAQ